MLVFKRAVNLGLFQKPATGQLSLHLVRNLTSTKHFPILHFFKSSEQRSKDQPRNFLHLTTSETASLRRNSFAQGQSFKIRRPVTAFPSPCLGSGTWALKASEFYSGLHRVWGEGRHLIMLLKWLIINVAFFALIYSDNCCNFPFCWVFAAT